jgi:DNA-binding NarL/FixJ family response regulator
VSTTILLVDDHRMMREGLRSILDQSKDLQVVGEAENGRQALAMISQLKPDIVVMDIGMPDLNGIEAVRQARAQSPGTRLIGLSMYTDKQYVLGMLEAGASGYVPKSAAADELIKAIHGVMQGRVHLGPDLAKSVVEKYVQQLGTGVTPSVSLGGREKEILQLIAEGNTSREIAELLHISVKTVEVHRQNIMNKLGLHSIAELTKYAIREGLTRLEG